MPDRTTHPRSSELLQELIAALDSRVPHVERAGEASIAEDAALLKLKAQRRLTELQREESDR